MSFKQGEAEWYDKFSQEFKDIQWRKPFVHSSVGGCTSAGGMLSTAAAIISLLPAPPCRVLDAGCAEGHLAKMLSLTGYEVTAVEVCEKVVSLSAIQDVQWNNKQSCVAFKVGDFNDIFCMNCFDVVVFSDSLHHSTDRAATLYSMWLMLKPGGILIANEPGIGHTKAAKNWAEKYNVTEQSVIPWKLKRMAKKIGFVDVKFYPNPTTLHKSVYELEGLNHHPLVKWGCKIFGASLVSFAKPFHGLTTMRKP